MKWSPYFEQLLIGVAISSVFPVRTYISESFHKSCHCRADKFMFYGYDNIKTRFHLFNDGIVRWDLPVHATTSCDVSILRFPFDSQSCYMEFLFMEVNNVDVVLNVSTQVV